MSKWQIVAMEEVTAFLNRVLPIEKIDIYGSVLDFEQLDVFSDVDMSVFPEKGLDFQMQDFIRTLSGEYEIFGYQIIRCDTHDLLRVCFETGWRFDISFFYSKEKIELPAESFEDKVEAIVNEFWYITSLVLAKIGRGDYLVAAHLVLELCQMTIVIQMLIRDDEKGTNVHRFGDKENVPILASLFDLMSQPTYAKDDGAEQIRAVLFRVAKQMDEISVQFNHQSKSHCLYALAKT